MTARPWAGPLLRRLAGPRPGAVPAAGRRPPAAAAAPAAAARPGAARRLGRHLGDGRRAAEPRPGLRGDRPPDPVRHPVRLDLGRLLDRPDGRDRAAARARAGAAGAPRRRCAAAAARSGRAHRDHHADLQRARADRVRRPGGDDRFAARHRRIGGVRRLRPQRQQRSRHPRRRAGGLERPRRPARRRGRRRSAGAAPALPLAAAPDPAQGRQRRRLLPPLGRRLSLLHRPRRRQRHDRRMPDDAWCG